MVQGEAGVETDEDDKHEITLPLNSNLRASISTVKVAALNCDSGPKKLNQFLLFFENLERCKLYVNSLRIKEAHGFRDDSAEIISSMTPSTWADQFQIRPRKVHGKITPCCLKHLEATENPVKNGKVHEAANHVENGSRHFLRLNIEHIILNLALPILVNKDLFELNKPIMLKGLGGFRVPSEGSSLVEIGAEINVKAIRNVRTTFEFCDLGFANYDGILGMPGIRALQLTMSHDGTITSEYEKKAFKTPIIAKELEALPPRLPMDQIRTGEDVVRAFPHCFCDGIRDMGKGSTITAPELRMLSAKPIHKRQYPIPAITVPKVKALVKELEEVGIVEECTSLWNSPLFPVAKSDGSVRITLDLRLINDATEFFPFPIPRVEDNLRAFAGAKVFSTLDLTSGFFQIHIPECDRDYFAFSLPWGRYRFARLAQGAKNSAQIFQWAMNIVLGDLLFKCVRLYIDDVIVYSSSFEQHVADLAAVPERLSKFRLPAKRAKSYFFRDSVEYLGHTIDQEGIKPLYDNVAALRDMPRPKNIRAVRSLLGMVNYYRRVCKALGISAVNTTAWRPQSNGAVERQNRTVIESLRRCACGSNWDNILPMVAFAIRSTEHASTGYTPAKLLYGYELRQPQPFEELRGYRMINDSINHYATAYKHQIAEKMETAREKVRQTYLKGQDEAGARFAESKLRVFPEGQLVLVERMHETKGRHKLEPRYEGPFLVLERTGETVYLLEDTKSGKRDKFHVDRMKAYYEPIRTYPPNSTNDQEQESEEDEEFCSTNPGFVNFFYPLSKSAVPPNNNQTAPIQSPDNGQNSPAIRRSTRERKPTRCRLCDVGDGHSH
ncbi:hypothetical protein LAZ67_X002821 [Cordylochernes scorpioides]|uniref:Reverse transcriptase n=1 Tax=Cordylochernes scorpioides TaxID=51811 RepID=A0ABY6LTN4_9ARAC|nr:hypothetical protein LAZ67_X002821 [Cordylochernes scorpioides]